MRTGQQCPVCGKWKGNLKQHMDAVHPGVHPPTGPYIPGVCPICGAKKKGAQGVQDHIRVKHPLVRAMDDLQTELRKREVQPPARKPPPPRKPKRTVCPICMKMVGDLKAHMGSAHPQNLGGRVTPRPVTPCRRRVVINYILCNEYDLKCPDCGKDLELVPGNYGTPYYRCESWPHCKGSHGADCLGEPLGIPGDQKTRLDRRQAHTVFDRIWKEGRMSRASSYAWMQKVMGMSEAQAHISRLNSDQCVQLIESVLDWMGSDLQDVGEEIPPPQKFDDLDDYL